MFIEQIRHDESKGYAVNQNTDAPLRHFGAEHIGAFRRPYARKKRQRSALQKRLQVTRRKNHIHLHFRQLPLHLLHHFFIGAVRHVNDGNIRFGLIVQRIQLELERSGFDAPAYHGLIDSDRFHKALSGSAEVHLRVRFRYRAQRIALQATGDGVIGTVCQNHHKARHGKVQNFLHGIAGLLVSSKNSTLHQPL